MVPVDHGISLHSVVNHGPSEMTNCGNFWVEAKSEAK